jgi:hypothetical protein
MNNEILNVAPCDEFARLKDERDTKFDEYVKLARVADRFELVSLVEVVANAARRLHEHKGTCPECSARPEVTTRM